MYLSDREIKGLLDELDITGPQADYPFEPEKQVQPCSIDLRVADVFWQPRRTRRWFRRLFNRRAIAVDLRRSRMHELDPRRYWKRVALAEGETLTIKPGQVLMGRIYERLQIPKTCAGKIEGRSSFARLGLAIHCTGDFINPGWQGYMPLQLFNAGPYPIRITPYVSLCQLMLVRVSGEVEASYGDPSLQSKYINDDGGPSLWWRDEQIRKLQTRLGEVHATEGMQQRILNRVRFVNPDVLERFEGFVAERRVGDVENADDLLTDFANRENRLRFFDRAYIASLVLLLGGILSSLFAPFSAVHVVLVAGSALSVFLAIKGYLRQDGGYLGTKELLMEDRPGTQSS